MLDLIRHCSWPAHRTEDQAPPVETEKRKAERRLAVVEGGREPGGPDPDLADKTIRCDAASGTRAISAGGIGAMHMLADVVGLTEARSRGASRS